MNDDTLIGKRRGIFFPRYFPTILPFTTSWRILEETDLSLARIGDGELMNAAGRPCGFENGGGDMADVMWDILSSYRSKCAVGLNRAHFYTTENTLPTIDRYCSVFWPNLPCGESMLMRLRKCPFLDACLTIPRHHYAMPERFWEWYFERVTRFLSKHQIILVTGDAESVPFYREFSAGLCLVPCPKKGAWVDRNNLIRKVRQLNPNGDSLVVAVCGPTATALAWELCDDMRVLDLGHLSREYQYWKRGSDPARDLGVFFGS